MQIESSEPSLSRTRTILRVIFTGLLYFGVTSHDYTYNAQLGMYSQTDLWVRIGISVCMGLAMGWIIPWMANRWSDTWLFRWKIRR